MYEEKEIVQLSRYGKEDIFYDKEYVEHKFEIMKVYDAFCEDDLKKEFPKDNYVLRSLNNGVEYDDGFDICDIEIYENDGFLKSPLNYTGGKFKLLKQITPFFPKEIDTFYDLFAGGCNVALNVQANKKVCNDILTPLIDLYKSFKEHNIDEVYRHIHNRIKEYDLSKENKEGYLQLRKEYNEFKNPLDMFVLICYAFNYSIRFNSKGDFNIAFGKDRSSFNKNISDRLEHFLCNITNIDFENKSFIEYLDNDYKKDDFVYIDPPYLITVANYNENDGWCEDREKQLYNFLDVLNEKGIKFALSNVFEHKGKSNDILKEWAKKYNINYLDYNYGNCSYHTKDKSKNSTVEVLITNYAN